MGRQRNIGDATRRTRRTFVRSETRRPTQVAHPIVIDGARAQSDDVHEADPETADAHDDDHEAVQKTAETHGAGDTRSS